MGWSLKPSTADRKKKEKGGRMRQGAWPRKNSEIKEGLLAEVAGTTPELGETEPSQRWEGRVGTGTQEGTVLRVMLEPVLRGKGHQAVGRH